MTENVLVKFPDPPPPNAHIELVDEHRAVVEMRYVPDYFGDDSSRGFWRCVTNGNRGQNWAKVMTTAIQRGLAITWRIPPIEVQDGQMVQVRFSDNVCAAGKLVRLPDGGVRVEVDVPEPQADMLRRLVNDGAFSRVASARPQWSQQTISGNPMEQPVLTEEIKRTLETDHQIPPSEAELDAVAALGYDRETFRAKDGTFDATSTDLIRRKTAAKLGVARAKVVHGTDPALTSLPDDDAAGDLLARRRPIKDNPQA